MSGRSVEHATFVVERAYPAPPDRVFAAWAEPEAKARWFGSPDDHLELDFRVGGRELGRGSGPDGNVYTYRALYQDIIVGERIVYTYDMLLGEARISVSVVTVEFRPDGGGTRLVLTEQGVFLDGHDSPALREHGTGALLDALGTELGAQR
ncbi:MAG TPA: SRPBCC family protein [Gaiellales bacterium]|nr:SRPBCC family protein [Gaiellales bacterium]